MTIGQNISSTSSIGRRPILHHVLTVRHKRSKAKRPSASRSPHIAQTREKKDSLLAHDAMPRRLIQPIKLALQILGHILLHRELFQRLVCQFDGFFLHRFLHVDALDDGFRGLRGVVCAR